MTLFVAAGRGGKSPCPACRGVALAKTGLCVSSERSERVANFQRETCIANVISFNFGFLDNELLL